MFRSRGFKTSKNDHPACLCPSVRPSDRYLGKEGWAPASYLKKVKEDFSSPRKKTLTGPVEIIGNIMEISNLLQKKSVSEKDIPTDEEGGGGGGRRAARGLEPVFTASTPSICIVKKPTMKKKTVLLNCL